MDTANFHVIYAGLSTVRPIQNETIYFQKGKTGKEI